MSVIGTFYAIREKGTLKYLSTTATNRGHTHSEPCAGPQPRLFPHPRAARLALTAWLKGRAAVSYSTDWETGHQEEYGLEYTPDPARTADRMEIVAISLIAEEVV